MTGVTAAAPQVRLWAFVRRRPIVIGLLLLLLVVRIALPYVLRPFLERRVSDAINGHVEIGDVDFWLVRGGLALENVAVFAEPPGPDPVMAWRELYARIAWLELLRKSLVFREVVVGQPLVDLDRLVSGDLNLLLLIATGPEAEPEQPDAAEALSGWTVAVDRLVFDTGHIRFRDFFIEHPGTLETDINRFEVSRASTSRDTYEEPAQLELDATVAGAPVHLAATFRQLAEGVSVGADLETENLPIRFVRYYLSKWGIPQAYAWSELRGHLNLSLRYDLETGVRDELRGHVALRDVAITVPNLDRPTLQYSLAVELGTVDLLHRRADIASVDLRDAAIVLNPAGSPLLPGLISETATDEGTSAPAAGSPDANAVGEEASAEEHDDVAGTDEAGTSRWRWTVAALDVERSRILVLGKDEELDVGLQASVENLVDHGGDGAPIEVTLQEGDASLTVKGALRVQPIGFAGDVRWADFSLPRLLAAARGEPWPIFRSARSSGELHILAGMAEAGRGPADAPTAVAAGTVTITGRVDVTGMELSESEPDMFSAKWAALNIDIEEIRLPGVLVAAVERQSPEPIMVRINRINLSQPEVHLARTAEGLIVPSLAPTPTETTEEAEVSGEGQAGEAGGAPDGQTPVASPPTEEPGGVSTAVTVAAVGVDDGRVFVIDHTVEPAFHGELTQIDLDATDIAWPERRVGQFSLSMARPKGGRLSLKGGGDPASLQLSVNGEQFDLPPFNPYASAYSAYRIGDGMASLTSSIRLSGERYETTNQLVLHNLNLSGAGGEDSFEAELGIPLSLALALMRDRHGDITLDVPVSGDRTGAKVGVGTVAASALRRVILNALTSPLKLIGAVTLGDGKVKGFTIEPVTFLPGRALVTTEGDGQVERIATLLAERPRLVVELEGTSTADDVLRLQEEDLIAEIREGGDMPEIPEGTATEDAEDAIEDYLEARADDEPAELPAAAEPALQALLGQREVSPQRLTELAEARAMSVRTMLEEKHSIGSKQVEIKPPSTGVRQGAPAVIISIGTS